MELTIEKHFSAQSQGVGSMTLKPRTTLTVEGELESQRLIFPEDKHDGISLVG